MVPGGTHSDQSGFSARKPPGELLSSYNRGEYLIQTRVSPDLLGQHDGLHQ